jgi:hypothetical protein
VKAATELTADRLYKTAMALMFALCTFFLGNMWGEFKEAKGAILQLQIKFAALEATVITTMRQPPQRTQPTQP